MPGLLDSLLGNDTETIDKLRPHTDGDPQRAEHAYGAAVGTILRGLQDRTETEDGAQSLWDMIRKHVEQGNILAQAPSQVQGGFAKVITLAPATAQRVFEWHTRSRPAHSFSDASGYGLCFCS